MVLFAGRMMNFPEVGPVIVHAADGGVVVIPESVVTSGVSLPPVTGKVTAMPPLGVSVTAEPSVGTLTVNVSVVDEDANAEFG